MTGKIVLVLTGPGVAGKADIWGMVSLAADPDLEKAEYAIVIDRRIAGLGLGYQLMGEIISRGRKRGIREVVGEVLRENESMLKINQALGFIIENDPDDPNVVVPPTSLSSSDARSVWKQRA